MAIDYKWMSNGGVLLDASGDIAFSDDNEGIKDMIRSRVKAELNGWKLYKIGANLPPLIGNAIDAQLETVISRRIVTVLSKELLPRGSFQVRTLTTGSMIDVFIYLDNVVAVTATATRNGDSLQVQAVN